MNCVPKQIELLAWYIDPETEKLSIYDIVQTSYHFAYHFTRKWVKDSKIVKISARKPIL